MDEENNLIQQLRGRAKFLRVAGEVKSPDLMERAANQLERIVTVSDPRPGDPPMERNGAMSSPGVNNADRDWPTFKAWAHDQGYSIAESAKAWAGWRACRESRSSGTVCGTGISTQDVLASAGLTPHTPHTGQ